MDNDIFLINLKLFMVLINIITNIINKILQYV